jgi:hypothetical protein
VLTLIGIVLTTLDARDFLSAWAGLRTAPGQAGQERASRLPVWRGPIPSPMSSVIIISKKNQAGSGGAIQPQLLQNDEVPEPAALMAASLSWSTPHLPMAASAPDPLR